jgi:hypothetical protein
VLSLRELQVSLAAAVLDGEPGACIAEWIRPDGLDPNSRVDIYRNNAREAFLKALALEFPVIQRLVGEDYFRQLAREFQSEHPSRAGDLQAIGAPFAGFLRARFTSTPYAYLPDVAALEWAYQESLVAGDAGPMDLTVLQTLLPHKLVGVRFEFHPACRLVHSPFPVVRIWLANQDDCNEPETIDLREGPDYVLLRRHGDAVEFHHLPPGDFRFLQALNEGRALGDSLEIAQRAGPDFDLARALRQFVGLSIFTAMHPT